MNVTCLMCEGLKGRVEEGTVESGPYFVPCRDCNGSGEVSIEVAADQQRQIDAWEASDAAYAEAYPDAAEDYEQRMAEGDKQYGSYAQLCEEARWHWFIGDERWLAEN